MAEMQAPGRYEAPVPGESYGAPHGSTSGASHSGAAAYQAAPQGAVEAPVGKSFGTLLNFTGAAVSLGLVVGIGVWGYQLVTRDVSGVPVVRAAEGPMRVQPADPGGARAENQGLAVNQVAAIGAAEAPADRLILAPKPIDLDASDAVSVAAAPDIEVSAPAQSAPAATATGGETNLSVEALVNQLMIEAQPLGTATTDEVLQQAALTQDVTPEVTPSVPAAEAAAKVITPVKGGLGTSLRPKARPAGGARVASRSPAPVAPVDVAPTDLPVGTRLAQLGAYESDAIARKEWDRLSRRFGEFLQDKQRVIQKAQSGGRTFYRLRAHGFVDLSEARRFCSALQAEKAECIPVTHK